MATEAEPNQPGGSSRRYRLNIEQFRKSIEVGVFPQGLRLELLAGILVPQSIETDPNEAAIDALGEELRKMAPEGWIVREQKSLTLGHYSREVPDLAIVRGPRSLYGNRAPTEGETALIVEVSGVAYRLDRGLKWRLAASAAVPAYWIANLAERRVEVYRSPEGRGRSATYRETQTFGPGEEVPVILGGQGVGRVAVRAIFP